jgi:hypothetical protein
LLALPGSEQKITFELWVVGPQGQRVKKSLLSFGLVQPGNFVFKWAEGGVVGADDENNNIFSRAGGWP